MCTRCGIVGGGKENVSVVVIEVVDVAGWAESSLLVVVHLYTYIRVPVSLIEVSAGQSTHGPWMQTCRSSAAGGGEHVGVVVVEMVGVWLVGARAHWRCWWWCTIECKGTSVEH